MTRASRPGEVTMFDFSQIEEVRLAAGPHDSAAEGLCFMEMVAWFAGERHSDKPECACQVLGTYGIRLNDGMPDDVRDRLLKPLVPLIAGTRDPEMEQKRAEFLAMWAVNKMLPIILRSKGHTSLAERCEKAKDLEEARSAANAANAAANAVYAVYVAHAAADAANAAYVANAAADAAADAVYAAYTAYAAANAAANAADADGIWTLAVEGLRQAILIGRHDGLSLSEGVIVERRNLLRALVQA